MRLALVLDCRDPDGLAEFWTSALDYRRSASAGPYVVLVPDGGGDGSGGPELVLQRVSEPKTTKNRMHVDIHTEDLDSTVRRLTDLGARALRSDTTEEAGCRWMVMADPEGNEFCVCVDSC